jgi:hypothetical protein
MNEEITQADVQLITEALQAEATHALRRSRNRSAIGPDSAGYRARLRARARRAEELAAIVARLGPGVLRVSQ